MVPREDGARRPAGPFGSEAGPDADAAAAGKGFYYIPGTVSRGRLRAGPRPGAGAPRPPGPGARERAGARAGRRPGSASVRGAPAEGAAEPRL